jgi:choline-sulfatase
VVTLIDGNVEEAGTKQAETTVKTEPVPDQIEVYDVTRDPLELTNLADSSDPRIRATVARLRGLLAEQRALKRRVPSSGTVPGQPRPL